MADVRRLSEHRIVVPTLLVLATIFLFAGSFAVWVNRQALNTDNWVKTSEKLLAKEEIRDALGAYLVNQLFTNVDVASALQEKLPAQAQPLAGPAAAGVRELANRLAPELLARPRVQDAWVTANRVAHGQLINVVEGGGDNLSTTGGKVVLNVHDLVTDLANNLGLGSQLAAARTQIQGSKGAQARALAQQKLGVTIPASVGNLTIMESDQLGAAQDIAGAVKGLAIALPLIGFLMLALAVYLARGRRRRALRMAGFCLVIVGLLLLIVRKFGGNEIVDSLVKVPSNESAVHEVWNIATSLLYSIAIALLAYGLVTVVAAWLAGPTRPATFLRHAMAPTLRESPGVAYGVAGAVLLLVVLWGPTPAFRNFLLVLVFAGLLALGVTMLRRETELEFPRAKPGEAWRQLRAKRPARPGGRAAAPIAGDRLAELERLVALHDSGGLTDEEFAAEKTLIVTSSR
jgi:hypothetical protein